MNTGGKQVIETKDRIIDNPVRKRGDGFQTIGLIVVSKDFKDDLEFEKRVEGELKRTFGVDL